MARIYHKELVELGERIRHFRQRAALTQNSLADKSGISRITISLIESGRRTTSPGTIKRLADALLVAPELLTGRLEKPTNPQADVHTPATSKPLLREKQVKTAKRRLTLDISSDFESALSDLSTEQSASKSEIVRSALQSYLENLGYESHFRHEDVSGQKLTRRIRIRSAKQVLFHSTLLISAFEEALDYDAQRHHNQPPPALRLEDNEYLEELRKLVTELKLMNTFLANLKAGSKSKGGPPGGLRKHLDIFLKKYSATLGYGAGVMTLGLVATLLYQLGAGDAVFDHVLKKIPSR